MIGWRKSSLLRQPITLLNSCFRFASREQIRLVENGLKEIQTQQAREDLITLDMIPSDVMNQLMKEIRTDPVLEQILNDFDFQEEVLDEGTVPENVWGELDIGLDIEIDDRLEQEIDSIVQF